MSASIPTIRLGDFDSARLITRPTINEPVYGFDVGSAEYHISSPMITTAGSLSAALTSAGLVRNAPFTAGIAATGLFYVNELSKVTAPTGGVNVRVTFRGYGGTLPVSGFGKFARLPYSAEISYKTAGGEGQIINLANRAGELQGRFVNQQLSFTDPGVSFQDSYIANGTGFDPCDEAKRNLISVGAGTNWGSNIVLSDAVKITVITGIGGFLPPGVRFTQLVAAVPGAVQTVAVLPKTGASTWTDGTWTLSFNSTDLKWELTDGTTDLERPGNVQNGPEGHDYTDDGFSGASGDLDAVAGVLPDTDDGFAKDTPLTDWFEDTNETSVGDEFDFDWPLVRWRSRLAGGTGKQNNYNYNWGLVLVNREADQVCPDPTVKLWHIVDTYQTYNQVELR